MIFPAFRLSSFRASLLALLVSGSVAALHSEILETRLDLTPVSIGARAGFSVRIDRDLIVVGAPDDDIAVTGGAVFVFARNGDSWEKRAKLIGPNPVGFREFGESVAVNGDTIVVGSPFDGPLDSSGRAYVYHRSGQIVSLQAILVPNDSAVNQQFGHSVAIDNDTIVVGAVFDTARGQSAGAAYVFTRKGQTWSQLAKLTASNVSGLAFFGWAVAVSGNTMVVGAPAAELAYVFSLQHGSWTEEAILAGSEELDGFFGGAVSIGQSTLVIGAPTEGAPGPVTALTGAAYVFAKKGNRWEQQEKLTASNGVFGDRFGSSVAISGRQIAVGAPYHFVVGPSGTAGDGTVYLFAKHAHDWREQSHLTGNPPTRNFGISASLDGNTLVVGSPGFYVDDLGLDVPGHAIVFPTR